MTEVGCGTRLVMRDLRTSSYLTSNSAKNVREHWAWARTAGATSGCNGGAAVKADAIGEQQPKRHDQGAVEVDKNGEQQLKQTQAASSS